MNIKPIRDRVLVKRAEVADKTPGGIIIPETSKDKPMKGIVVAVGEGIRNSKGELIPLTVKEGDIVFFSKWAGTEIECDKQFILIKEEEILGILDE